MGFDGVLRAGLLVLDEVTSSLQVEVQHFQWIRQDEYGDSKYDSPVGRQAIVEPMHKMVHLADGRQVAIIAKVQFIRPIPPHGAVGRVEPIDHRDKIVLPDGQTGPIIKNPGITDPTTTRPYFNEIMLGAGS